MEQREKDKNKSLKHYPLTQDECFQPKECPACDGWGVIADSKCCGGSIVNGLCDICHRNGIDLDDIEEYIFSHY